VGFDLQFRRYRLPFRAPVRTSHGVWPDREGVLIRLATEDGRVGFGEAAPIPWFGTETCDEIEHALRSLGPVVTDEQLDAIPPKLRCLRHALGAARDRLRIESSQSADTVEPRSAPGRDQVRTGSGQGADHVEPQSGSTRDTERIQSGPSALAVAASLGAGRVALQQIDQKAEAGFRVFKWKVGVADARDELVLLDELCARLPEKAKLRLDANGAWDRRTAEKWLERCAEYPVEFIEQPCFAEPNATPREKAKADDLLHGLANDFPTPIALDESVVSDGDVERWLAEGWRGVFVLKPSLLANPSGVLAQLRRANAEVVFSSALETPVGANAALAWAFRWSGAPRALGFGVWPLFADARFDAPFSACFIRAEDVERINPEAVWNALS